MLHMRTHVLYYTHIILYTYTIYLYHMYSVEDAIEETVHWRRDFGISKIDLVQIKPLLESGMAYVSPTLDKHGRTIIMVYTSIICMHMCISFLSTQVPYDAGRFLYYTYM